jgi:hypothetical protein
MRRLLMAAAVAAVAVLALSATGHAAGRGATVNKRPGAQTAPPR